MVKKFQVETNSLRHADQAIIAVVTGSSSGIGYMAARSLYIGGAHVILACRNEQKTLAAIERMKQEVKDILSAKASKASSPPVEPQGQLEFMVLDTSSMASVRAFAKAFLDRALPLHLLINNAGIAGLAKHHETSKDQFEMTWATNYVGHFLLTQLLMPVLTNTSKNLPTDSPLPAVRVVNVSSRAHEAVREQPNWDAQSKSETSKVRSSVSSVKAITTYPPICKVGIAAYGLSKFANIVHTSELSRRWKEEGVTKLEAYSLHPGVVATDIWRKLPGFLQPFLKFFMISEEEGSFTTLYCALSKDVSDHQGEYFDNCALAKRTKLTKNVESAKELWSKSEQWIKAGE